MKLRNAARYFDRTVVTDAFDPDVTFKGQMDLFQDVVRDGSTAERRILSVDPGIEIPAHKVVIIDGDTWIVGQLQKDHFKGEAIRHKHVLQLAHGFTALKTFVQAIAGETGRQAWSAMQWVKTIKEPTESSTELGLYELTFADTETVAEGNLLQLRGMWLLIRTVYPSLSGYTSALADQLEGPVLQQAVFASRTYNPASDSYAIVPATITVIKLRWQSYFRYPTQASFKFKVGDDVVIINKTDLMPKANDTFTLDGARYTVASVLDEGPHWSCHVTRT